MELKAETRVSFPRELVFRTYRDNLPDTVPFLPNVESIKVEERKEEDGHVKLLNIWSAKTDIPSVAKKFVKPEMLMWIDKADWHEAEWVCHWVIETHAFPGLVECTGSTSFVEDGQDTLIQVNGSLILHLEKAHVPRLLAGTVQPLIEKVVIGALKPNLLSTGEGVEKYLKAQAGK
jgi:hypothetical protein